MTFDSNSSLFEKVLPYVAMGLLASTLAAVSYCSSRELPSQLNPETGLYSETSGLEETITAYHFE